MSEINLDKTKSGTSSSNDEISLKELILKVHELFEELFLNKKLILLVTVPFIITFLLFAIFTKPTFTAKLTFMVNEENGSNLGGVSALLGQFGFGAGSEGNFNLDKISELARSRKIVTLALFEKVPIEGKVDFLANHIIDKYEFQEEWKDEENGLQGFYFETDNFENFERHENKALKEIYNHVVGNSKNGTKGLFSNSYGIDTGILTLETCSISEELSIHLTKTLYAKLAIFYVEKTIGQQKKTYEILKKKVDSLDQSLNNANYELLRFEDQNRNLTLRQYEAKKIKLQGEARKLAVAYGEAYKNLEMADFQLKNKTPFVTIIDYPIPPIRPKRESKIKAIIMGGLLGGVFAFIVVLGRKVYRDALS